MKDLEGVSKTFLETLFTGLQDADTGLHLDLLGLALRQTKAITKAIDVKVTLSCLDVIILLLVDLNQLFFSRIDAILEVSQQLCK